MKKNLKGRSMTEMLGVLAIIGVLSIVAVSVFRTAMTKHQANNVIEDVKLAGFIVTDELFSTLPEEEISIDNRFAKQTDFNFTAFKESNMTFGVVIDNVPEKLCLELKSRKVEWLEEIRPNGKDNVCKDENNAVTFFFNLSLNGNTEVQNPECRTDKDCPEGKPYCRSGYCAKCETGLELNNGTCVECPTGNNIAGGTTADLCHTMCGDGYYHTNGYCVTCNITNYWATSVSKDECDLCPNRCWDENDQKCYYTIDAQNEVNNNGICNYTCPTGKFVSISGGQRACLNCPTGNNIVGTSDGTFCHSQCGEGYYHTNGYCVTCNITNYWAPSTSKDECDLCPNRCWDENDQKCYYTIDAQNEVNNNGICNYTCPTGKFVSISGGQRACLNCPTGNNIVGTSDGTFCHSQCGEGYYHAGKSYCALCSLTFDWATAVSKDECDLCPNRCWDEREQKCYLVKEGNSFNKNGICDYTCAPGEALHISQGARRCEACPTGNNNNLITTAEICHNTCGEGYYHARNYYCTSCDIIWSWAEELISKDECDRCPNRYFNEADEKCYLCPNGQVADENGTACVNP